MAIDVGMKQNEDEFCSQTSWSLFGEDHLPNGFMVGMGKLGGTAPRQSAIDRSLLWCDGEA